MGTAWPRDGRNDTTDSAMKMTAIVPSAVNATRRFALPCRACRRRSSWRLPGIAALLACLGRRFGVFDRIVFEQRAADDDEDGEDVHRQPEPNAKVGRPGHPPTG